jgi:hypothetical protein
MKVARKERMKGTKKGKILINLPVRKAKTRRKRRKWKRLSPLQSLQSAGDPVDLLRMG